MAKQAFILILLFDEQTLKNELADISDEENFFGLHSPGLTLDGFITHNKLPAGYEKLHIAKQNNWPE